VNLVEVARSYQIEAEKEQAAVTLSHVVRTQFLSRAALLGCAGFVIQISSGE
jgi:hypothetical protein